MFTDYLNPLSFAQKVLAYALAGALAASLVANGVQAFQNSRLEKKLDTCQVDKAEAFGRIEVQNAGIADLKARADAAQAATAAAQQRADAAEKATLGTVKARQAAIAAPPQGKTCGDALKAIREGLKS